MTRDDDLRRKQQEAEARADRAWDARLPCTKWDFDSEDELGRESIRIFLRNLIINEFARDLLRHGQTPDAVRMLLSCFDLPEGGADAVIEIALETKWP